MRCRVFAFPSTSYIILFQAIKRLEALCDANNWCYCAVLTSAIHHVQACAPLDTFPRYIFEFNWKNLFVNVFSEAVEAAQCTLAMTDSFVVLQAANLHPRVIQSIEFRVYNKGTKYEEILIPHSVHKYYDV